MRSILKKKKRIVIKIGSSILINEEGRLFSARFRALAAEVAWLRAQKKQVVLVSSGAIAAGMDRLDFKRKPHQIAQLQAIAAAGQIALMNEYEKAFHGHGMIPAQILLTRDDLANRKRFLNARHAISELLQLGIIPIINENDTVAVDEIKVGDNDNLSSLVTNLVEGELLIILSDIDGVYDFDPRIHPDARRIPAIKNIDAALRQGASDTLRQGSTGGMRTKLEAAEKAAHYGALTVIANGAIERVIQKITDGEEIGTIILPKESADQLSARKHWLAYTVRAAGTLYVDRGAKEAIMEQGRSLLPSGIQQAIGDFQSGDPIDIAIEGSPPFARGLASYNSQELRQIMGHKSSEIEKILGYKYLDEIVHRDDLVLL